MSVAGGSVVVVVVVGATVEVLSAGGAASPAPDDAVEAAVVVVAPSEHAVSTITMASRRIDTRRRIIGQTYPDRGSIEEMAT
jgi:ribosomal protein S12 methylthiotransferase accessory factor YcaO